MPRAPRTTAPGEGTLGRREAELTFTLTGRVASTKNSRRLANGRSFMSDVAKAWMQDAKAQLRQQYKGEPLEGCYALIIRAYYADGRHHLDLDNLASGIADSLKGIVLVDDKPKYIGALDVCSSLSRTGTAHVEVTLRELITGLGDFIHAAEKDLNR